MTDKNTRQLELQLASMQQAISKTSELLTYLERLSYSLNDAAAVAAKQIADIMTPEMAATIVDSDLDVPAPPVEDHEWLQAIRTLGCSSINNSFSVAQERSDIRAKARPLVEAAISESDPLLYVAVKTRQSPELAEFIAMAVPELDCRQTFITECPACKIYHLAETKCPGCHGLVAFT